MPEAFKKPANLKNNMTMKTTAVLKPAEVVKPTEVVKPAEAVKIPEKMIAAPPSPAGSWTIQVAALKDTVEADRIVARLKQQGYPAFRLTGEIVGKGVWHRVRIGPYPGREEADGVVVKLNKEGLSPIAINTGGGKE
jgi:cell division septation protein DedD